MSCFLKRVLPFCLAFCAGLGLVMLRNQNYGTLNCSLPPRAPVVTPLKVDFVPELNLTAAAKRSTGLDSHLQLIALFDGDGRIKEIRPHPMLPYGVPESEAGRGRFANYTPMLVDGQFVKELPFELTKESIEHVCRIRYTPKRVGGRPVSQLVIVNIEFSFGNSPDFVRGDSIDMTLMDDSGTLWEGRRSRVVAQD